MTLIQLIIKKWKPVAGVILFAVAAFFTATQFLIVDTGCGKEVCRPACRSGYECVVGTCTIVCNPECDSGFTCNSETGECEADAATTSDENPALLDGEQEVSPLPE